MLSLINNWKIFALLGSLLLNGLLYHQITRLDGKLQLCNADAATKLVAINLANDMRAEQERKLRLTEQEAAKARAESQKRKDFILNKEITGGCEGANQFLVDYALGFHWQNNIP